MSTVFLLGNGFDINCRINSRYTDMYQEYCKITEDDSEIIKKFKKEIENSIYDTWADFEIGMSKYAEKVNNENDFLSCLWDFKTFLVLYLKKQQDIFYSKINNSVPFIVTLKNEVERSINEFYKGNRIIERDIEKIKDDKIKFICFNYTDIAKFLTKPGMTSDSLYEYDFVQIHGTLNKNNSAVIGIDNINQVRPNFDTTNKFSRAFIKSELINEVDDFRIYRAEQFISDANIICVYGLSLGDTDLRWRNAIIEKLKREKDAHLFFFSYELMLKENLFSEQELNFEEDKKNDLLAKWNITDSKEIFDRIHIPCGKKIFCFDEIFQLEEEHKDM